MGKERIPKALREQVWVSYIGKRFEKKCWIPWCKNTMSVFDFHVGHNLPESKGGTLEIGNLRPICARCNLSMSDTYTISEWMAFAGPKRCCGLICSPPPEISRKIPSTKSSTPTPIPTPTPKKTSVKKTSVKKTTTLNNYLPNPRSMAEV